MSGSINDITAIQNNYSEEAIQNELRKTEETEKTERQSPFEHPTNDPAQAGQTSANSIIARGMNLNQIVLVETAPRKEEIGKDDNTVNKAVSALSTQSAIGTTAEENGLPSEIQTRNDLE